MTAALKADEQVHVFVQTDQLENLVEFNDLFEVVDQEREEWIISNHRGPTSKTQSRRTGSSLRFFQKPEKFAVGVQQQRGVFIKRLVEDFHGL